MYPLVEFLLLVVAAVAGIVTAARLRCRAPMALLFAGLPPLGFALGQLFC